MQDLAKITSLTGWPEIRKSLEESFLSTLQTPSYEDVELQIRIAEENEVRGLTRRQIVFPYRYGTCDGVALLPEGGKMSRAYYAVITKARMVKMNAPDWKAMRGWPSRNITRSWVM